MPRFLMRGNRRIMAITHRGPGAFEVAFDCGHTEMRPQKPRDGCHRAICKECRRSTAPRSEGAPQPAESAAATKRLRVWRAAQGLCVFCGATAVEGIQMCQSHREQQNARWHARRRAKHGASPSNSTPKEGT